MAGVNVTDRSFWLDFFRQEPDGGRNDYEKILRINHAIDFIRIEDLVLKLAGSLDPKEILKFLDIDPTQIEINRLGVTPQQVEELQNRLRAYQAKKSAELARLEARDDAASTARAASRWADVTDTQLEAITTRIKGIALSSDEIGLADIARLESIIMGAALLVATHDRDALLHLVDPKLTAIPVLLNESPLTFIAAQVAIVAAKSPSLEKQINVQLNPILESYREHLRISVIANMNLEDRESGREFAAEYIRGVMSEIEDFVIARIMTSATARAPSSLYIKNIGRFTFVPNRGLILNTNGGEQICPIPEDLVIESDGMKFPIGEIYPRLARVTGISPYSGGHIVPRNLTEQETKTLTDLSAATGPTPTATSSVSFTRTNLGIAVGSLNTPYKGPNITVVTSNGKVFEIREGKVGRIYLSPDDVIQIGDNTPVYLPVLSGRISDDKRIELPATTHVLDQQIHFDDKNGKLKIKTTSRLVQPGTHVVTHEPSGGVYFRMTHEDLQRQIANRNSVHDYLQGETDRLAILGLKPSDLIGKTLSDMGNIVVDAFAAQCPSEATPKQQAYDDLSKYIAGKLNSLAALSELSIDGPRKIQIPNSKPSKFYNSPEPTTHETPLAAVRKNNSLIGFMMGLKIMFASPNMENVANDVTPQHPIELRDSATQDDVDSHDSNARRISERPAAALARSRLAARARAARAVIRG